MYIKSIYLKKFRNYKEIKIPFQEKINIILGKNGHGKTNLLEGIHILSMGKSFRTNIDTEMINFDSDYFRVRGEFDKEGSALSVEMNMNRNDRLFKINGAEKRKNADLLENVYTVIFSPDDLRIIKEEPEKRRKFIDRQLFQLKPTYYKELAKYKKVLKNRNASLKEEEIDEGLLDVWDEYLIEIGAKIMIERKDILLKINEISREINRSITNSKENLKVEYEPYIDIKPDQEEQKIELRKIFQKSRKKDIERKTTTSGPHKDDIKISLDDIDTKKYGSQGQQKTAALALKLAELRIIKEETGEDAILLLDDVLSELDIDRQNYLINSFKDNQVIISAADISESIIKKLHESRIYKVNKGEISY